MRSLASSHVAAPLRGRACGAVAPRPSRHRRITPPSVPSGVPLCGLPFRESPPLSSFARKRATADKRPSLPLAFGHSPSLPKAVTEAAACLSAALPHIGAASAPAPLSPSAPSVAPAVAGSFDHGKRCFPFHRSPVPGEGSGEKKNSLMVGAVEAFSNARKSGPKIFQRSENPSGFFPTLGQTACRPFQGLELHARGEEGGARNRGVMRGGYSAVFKTVSSSSLTNLCLDFGNRRSSSICCSIFDAGPGRLRWPVPLSSTRSTTDTPSTSAAR